MPGMPMPPDTPLVALFCGSRIGGDERFAAAAAAVGRAIGLRRAGLVYGGGRVGLMGIAADAALEAGAPVLGVIPAGLATREVAHHGLTRLEVVKTMHERKAAIYGAARGFLALPGGLGTLDELFEALTWRQLGHHDKPVVLLNVAGYWDPLLGMLDRMRDEGFLGPEGLLEVETDPGAAVGRALTGA